MLEHNETNRYDERKNRFIFTTPSQEDVCVCVLKLGVHAISSVFRPFYAMRTQTQAPFQLYNLE